MIKPVWRFQACPPAIRLAPIGGKAIAEHGQTAKGFRAGRLVLEDVPVLGELAVLETHDVGGDPGLRTTVSRKAAMGYDVVALGEDHVIFVSERVGKAANKI